MMTPQGEHASLPAPAVLAALAALAALLLSMMAGGCASIGTPGGGPRDTIPPVVVRTQPPQGQLHFKGKRLTVTLNKNVQLDDAFNKVVISPAQTTAPAITSNGHTVTVELRDTLVPNTTYTIDFADAIKDLNEGNVLDGFATDFSTGASLDTLRISGMVLDAHTLEPAQGMIVGAYSNLSDSAIHTLPLERITKTNALGQFTLRNLKEGSYRIFALNDLNRDYHWDRSEDVAFLDTVLTPYTRAVNVADTLRGSRGQDSLALRTAPHYLPDDVLLTWFNENYRAQYIHDYARPERNRLTLTLGAPTDTLPRITLAGPDSLLALLGPRDLVEASVVNTGATLDTLELWLRPKELIAADTLRAAVSILVPDSTETLRWKADTVNFIYKAPRLSKKERQRLEDEARLLAEERRQRADSLGIPLDSLPPELPKREPLKLTAAGGSRQELNAPLMLTVSEPLDTLLSRGVRMEMKVDTLWTPLEPPVFTRTEPGRPLAYQAPYEWQPGTTYRLTVDSAAAVGIYGNHNDLTRREFTTAEMSDYGAIYFKVSSLPDSFPAVVELLDGQDKPLRRESVEQGVATFSFLPPATYYARLFVDRDGNGLWTNGSLSSTPPRQPEDVYYFPKKIALKKNWEVEQPWDLQAFPVDMQKPFDIKKNKPKNAAKPKDEEEGDDSGTPLPPGL